MNTEKQMVKQNKPPSFEGYTKILNEVRDIIKEELKVHPFEHPTPLPERLLNRINDFEIVIGELISGRADTIDAEQIQEINYE